MCMILVFALSLMFQAAHAACPTSEDSIRAYRQARQKVEAYLEGHTSLSTLPCAQMSIHGLQFKKVSGNCLPTYALGDETSAARFRFEKVPIFAPCQVFVSHKFRFVFVRQPKSASTAIMKAIKETFCKQDECSEHELLQVPKLSDKTWASYFTFTWVRNPWTRSMSAYRMMNKWFLRSRDSMERCNVSLADYEADVNRLRLACETQGCCPYADAWMPWFVDQHINDQSGCSHVVGDSVVDFVGRAESIQLDWESVVRHINHRLDINLEPSQVVNPNGQGDPMNGGVETLCSNMTDSTIRSIGSQYAYDVLYFVGLNAQQL